MKTKLVWVLKSIALALAVYLLPLSSRGDNSGRIQAANDCIARCNSEVRNLTEEKNRALRELASGMYCSECDRTRTEIEQGGVSFSKHLSQVNGQPVPASRAQLARKAQQFDQKINSAESRRQGCEQNKELAILDDQRAEQQRQQALRDNFRDFQNQKRDATERRAAATTDVLGKMFNAFGDAMSKDSQRDEAPPDISTPYRAPDRDPEPRVLGPVADDANGSRGRSRVIGNLDAIAKAQAEPDAPKPLLDFPLAELLVNTARGDFSSAYAAAYEAALSKLPDEERLKVRMSLVPLSVLTGNKPLNDIWDKEITPLMDSLVPTTQPATSKPDLLEPLVSLGLDLLDGRADAHGPQPQLRLRKGDTGQPATGLGAAAKTASEIPSKEALMAADLIIQDSTNARKQPK